MKRKPEWSNDHGLIVDRSTDPPTACGYLFDFTGHGIFSPDGKVQVTKAEADAHNKLLAVAEWEGMLKAGRGLLYLTGGGDEGGWFASDWPGVHRVPITCRHTSFHNMAGAKGRRDVWFRIPDAGTWHGVNIGDNQLLRVRRLKGGRP